MRLPISQDCFDEDDVRAGHIVPYSVDPETMDYLFGNRSGSSLIPPNNCLFVHRSVERADTAKRAKDSTQKAKDKSKTSKEAAVEVKRREATVNMNTNKGIRMAEYESTKSSFFDAFLVSHPVAHVVNIVSPVSHPVAHVVDIVLSSDEEDN